MRWQFLRRCAIVAALTAYVIVAAGVPLPTARQVAKNGELYPCASSSCGCDSAERCWSGCCCHTLAQRLAWAKEHNVRPPDFALDEARTAGLDTSAWDGSLKLVKATVAVKSCCAAKKHAVTPSCCSKKLAGAHGCCSSHGKPRSNDDATRNIVGWRALACHGQSLNWLAAVPTLVTVELELADQLPLVAWLGPTPLTSRRASPTSPRRLRPSARNAILSVRIDAPPISASRIFDSLNFDF